MAGVKLPPRQKMIGMMYLVLTALLALNVSKDILNAFILVNTGLESTVSNSGVKNDMLYADFSEAKSIDPDKVTPYWNKAQEAKSLSLTLIKYIEDLKKKLVLETDQIPANIADTIQLKYVNGKDNYDIPTNILIGQSEDGSKGLARELKLKLEQYKKDLLSLLNSDDQKSVQLDLNTNDIVTFDGTKSWEIGNFYHTPLAATITLLSKIQSDVKNAEFDVVNKIFKSVTKKDFKFDTIAAKVIAPSNYVMLGEDYRADVFVAAFSKTQDPRILIGDYDSTTQQLSNIVDSVRVEQGMGKYVVKTDKEGIFSYSGMINLVSPSGELKQYPFSSEYIVAKPSLVVSPTSMNVFYIGPDNPVDISVPGVASQNISATISGSGNSITKVGNGKYKVKLSNGSPRNVDVNVSATMPNGEKRSMGKMSFIVKKLPKPQVRVGQVYTRKRESKNQLAAHTSITPEYGPDFIFGGMPLRVSKCKIEVWRRGQLFKDWEINSKTIPNNIRDWFRNNAKSKDRVIFDVLQVKDVNNRGHGPFMVTIDVN